MSEQQIAISPALDAVLRKYGKIWIWSILSAAIAAFSLRSLTSIFQASALFTLPGNIRGQFTSGAVFVLLVTLIPSIAALFSVYYLLQSLRYDVLPILFPSRPTAPGYTLTGESAEENAPSEREENPGGPQLLYRAFQATVIAIALEGAAAVIAALMRLFV